MSDDFISLGFRIPLIAVDDDFRRFGSLVGGIDTGEIRGYRRCGLLRTGP